MSSVKGNDSLRDTVTLTPKILERMFYNHILRIKGRKKEEEARGEGREEEEEDEEGQEGGGREDGHIINAHK